MTVTAPPPTQDPGSSPWPEGVSPGGPQAPAPAAAAPPVLPVPADEYDLEKSIGMMRDSIYQRVQQINIEHLQRVAASGQMQQYEAAQMQTATGNDIEAEMGLMSMGMPMTNVRVPQNRKAYEDWFADMEQRQGAQGMHPQWPEVKKRYEDFSGLAQRFDSDKQRLGLEVERSLPYYESKTRAGMEVLRSGVDSALGGYVGNPSRLEEMGTSMNDLIEGMVTKRYPQARGDTPADKMGWTAAAGAEQEREGPRASYKRLLQEEAYDQLQKVAQRPGMHPGKANEFLQKAAGLLGMLAPMGAAGKAGVATAQAVAPEALKRLAPHVGQILGFAGYGAVANINDEQKQRIAGLPKEQQTLGETAARIENAATFGLLAPIWSVAGAAGAKMGSGLSKVLGGTGESTLRGLLQGAGTGLTLPLAGEAEQLIKAGLADKVPAFRDLVERKLVAKPELQGPAVGMVRSAAAGDGASFVHHLERYLKEAAPGMVAFGGVHAAHGFVTGKQARFGDEVEAWVREKRAQADREADKVAAGDKVLAEQLKQGLDRKEEAITEAVKGPPTREQELAERVGPEESERLIQKGIVEEQRGPLHRRLANLREIAPREQEESVREQEEPVREQEEPVREQEPTTLRKQERLLERQIKRTEDPTARAELMAQRDSLRASRRAADAEVVKPIEAAPEEARTAEQRVVEGFGRVESETKSPEVRRAAALRAKEWSAYAKETAAAGAGGPEPKAPTRIIDPGRVRGETEAVMLREAMAPMPARERAAARALAYQESPQRKVDDANAAGRPEVGQRLVDEHGNAGVVTAVRAGEAELTNAAGEKEPVELERGALPEDLRVTAVGERLQSIARSVAQSGSEKTQEAEGKPLMESTGVHEPLQREMDSWVDQIGGGRERSMLTELAALKTTPGAKSTDAAKAYAEVLAGKEGVRPIEKEFAEFVRDNADIAASRKGQRFVAEQLFAFLQKKAGTPPDPRGSTWGEIHRYLSEEVAAQAKLVAEVKDPELAQQWAAHHSNLLTGPWAAAARAIPDGQILLRKVQALADGKYPGSSAYGVSDPFAIPIRMAMKMLSRFRADNFATLMEQMERGPRTKADFIGRFLGGHLAMPAGQFGNIAKKGVAAVQEGYAAMSRALADVFHVKTGMLGQVKEGSQVDKWVHELLNDPAGLKGALAKRLWADRATEEPRQAVRAALSLKRWHEKILAAIKEVHPTGNRLRQHLEMAEKDLTTLTSHLAQWRAVQTPAGKRTAAAIQRKLTTTTNYRDNLRTELDKWNENYGLEHYIKNIGQFEILPGGVARSLIVQAKNGVSIVEARRRVYADLVKQRKGTLKAKGLLGDSAVRAVNHYARSVIPYIYRSRFLRDIDTQLYGNLERLSSREVLGGRQGVVFGDKEASNLGLHSLAKVKVAGPGGKTLNVPTFARARGAKTGQVLLWSGDPKLKPTAKQLADPKWIKRHLQRDKRPEGGLIAIPKSLAFETLRAFKGGWWEHADTIMQRNMVRYIGRVTGGLGELQSGVIGQEFGRIRQFSERFTRRAASWMSAMALGGPTNIHNAMNNVLGATMLNTFFLGGESGATKTMGQWLARHNLRLRQKVSSTKPSGTFDPKTFALSESWDIYRTPQAKLDKMTPIKRAEQMLFDDAMVAWMQSGLVNQHHGDRALGMSGSDARWGRIDRPGKLTGDWISPRRKAKWDASGGLEIVEPTLAERVATQMGNVAAKLRPITQTAATAWWTPFAASEALIRAPTFFHGYLMARRAGKNHSEALADGIATTHLLQMVYNKASKSEFLNNPAGVLLGNLGQWAIGTGGRLLSLPKSKFLALAGYNTALVYTFAHFFGLDTFDIFGARMGNVPIVGKELENIALGLGWKTQADPQGLSHKGPLYGMGLRSLPIPFPVTLQFGPGVKVAENLLSAVYDYMQGNGMQAAQKLQAAQGAIDPRYSNWMRQLRKAFAPGNVQEPGGSQVFMPPGQATPKGSTVLGHTGFEQYALQMLPGSLLTEALQWQETQLSKARGAYFEKKEKELGMRGKVWATAALRAKHDPATAQLEKDMRTDVRGFAQQLGKKLSPENWRHWLQTADFEAKTDSRLRSVLAAPSKLERVKETTRLLSDANYHLTKERWQELAHRLGGQQGLSAWIWGEEVPPQERKAFVEALKMRQKTW